MITLLLPKRQLQIRQHQNQHQQRHQKQHPQHPWPSPPSRSDQVSNGTTDPPSKPWRPLASIGVPLARSSRTLLRQHRVLGRRLPPHGPHPKRLRLPRARPRNPHHQAIIPGGPSFEVLNVPPRPPIPNWKSRRQRLSHPRIHPKSSNLPILPFKPPIRWYWGCWPWWS